MFPLAVIGSVVIGIEITAEIRVKDAATSFDQCI